MGERTEYKKTIVFDSEESKMLYDSITAVESQKQGITQSAFVNSFNKDAFLPKHPMGRSFCERLYLADNTKESTLNILSDVFLFLAEKTEIERFTTNRTLVYVFYEHIREGAALKVKKGYIDEFQTYVDMLKHCPDELTDGQITLEQFFTSLEVSPDMFDPKLFVHKILDNWSDYAQNPICYIALSYLCLMLPDTEADVKTLRTGLIGLIRTMSKSRWELGSDN